MGGTLDGPEQGIASAQGLQDALDFSGHVRGMTHDFYHYPARFSPEFARTAIAEFSAPGDWVLDPFMGGGTSIVEGLSLGRNMLGVDINALAHFVTNVRTRPLSCADEELILEWAMEASFDLRERPLSRWNRPEIRNLPPVIETFCAGALSLAAELPLARQRAFARCVLLRLGQWALESFKVTRLRRGVLGRRLRHLTTSMLLGLEEFVVRCRASGVQKHHIRKKSLLLNRSAVGIARDPSANSLCGRIKLVVTSPPYPGVHVLYHRWQLQSRRETAAPYWIANVADGCGASFYTFGSRRTFKGVQDYSTTLTAAFRSVLPLLHQDAIVLQLVAFQDVDRQLAPYLTAMEAAGFCETRIAENPATRPYREVPNRRWYASLQGNGGAALEVLLAHRPA